MELPVPGVSQHLLRHHRVEGGQEAGGGTSYSPCPPCQTCPPSSVSPVDGAGEARRPLAGHHVDELLEGDGGGGAGVSGHQHVNLNTFYQQSSTPLTCMPDQPGFLFSPGEPDL